MSPALAQREIALAGITLLAAIIALALTSARGGGPGTDRGFPQPVSVAGSGWYKALAAPRRGGGDGRRTACGQILGPATLGVAHPVLPCGAKIFIVFGSKEVLTQVIDRGPSVSGHEFDLTPALADELGLHGTRPVRWSFARG